MSGAVLAVARELAPRIAAAGDEIERERRLPPHLVAALAGAGIFRMLVPRSIGGGEVDLATFAQVTQTIAQADGSAGWCVSQGAVSATIAAFLPPDTAREIFGAPDAMMAQGVARGTRAVAVDGGFRVGGEWSFGSGCHHATWLNAVGPVYEADGSPRRDERGAHEARAMLFPAAQAEIRDTWRVSGLRGTGSDTYVVRDLFIPADRTVPSARGRYRREPGPLYAFTTGLLFATGFAGVALGIARGALDAFIGLAQGKQPRGEATVLRENPVAQAQVAQAEATWRGARAFLHEAIAGAWEQAARGDAPALERGVLLRLAATNAIRRAAEVADVAYHNAGATAIFESNPFERRFRDAHAVTQQFQGSEVHFPAVGRFFLGLEPDPGSL